MVIKYSYSVDYQSDNKVKLSRAHQVGRLSIQQEQTVPF